MSSSLPATQKTPSRKRHRKPSISIPRQSQRSIPSSESHDTLSTTSSQDLPLLTPDPIRKGRRSFKLSMLATRSSNAPRSSQRRRKTSSTDELVRESGVQDRNSSSSHPLSHSLEFLQSNSILLFQRLSFNIMLMVSNMLVILYFLSVLVNGPVGETLRIFEERKDMVDQLGEMNPSATRMTQAQALLNILLSNISYYSNRYLFTNSSTHRVLVSNAHVLKYFVPYLFISFADIICVICSWVIPGLTVRLFGVISLSLVAYLISLRFVFLVSASEDAWMIVIAPLYAIGGILFVIHLAHMAFCMYDQRAVQQSRGKKSS